MIYRNGVWDLPKGKRGQGESIEACARREVAEETGIPLPVIGQFLIKTYHQYQPEGNLYKKETAWFKMTTVPNVKLVPQQEEGITRIEWVDIAEAKKKVGYVNLLKVLQKVQ